MSSLIVILLKGLSFIVSFSAFASALFVINECFSWFIGGLLTGILEGFLSFGNGQSNEFVGNL